MTRPSTYFQVTQGFTLLEVILVISIIGVLSGLTYTSYLNFQNPARDTARAVHGALYQLRANAAANTQARRMVLTTSGKLELQSALRCDEPDQSKWTSYGTVPLPDPSARRPVTLTRDSGSTTPNVIACYNARGLATVAGTLKVNDPKAAYTVQVALSGGVKTSAQ
ncbi:type II secretion system protein [Deinococcus kurensis]|uniref:type II secretion system protein n=1 Tax=Deinococcus kurensis TaxID=2662757 RepID=UPI0012D2FA52|nr:type II secretion system protein [Deinococcus kurensis]